MEEFDFVKLFKNSKLFNETPERIAERKEYFKISNRKSKLANLKKRMKSKRKRKKYYGKI